MLPHPWIPSANQRDREIMLKRIGVRDPLELFKDVPKELILSRKLKVGFGKPLSEWEIIRLLDNVLSRNKVFLNPPPFMGGGLCAHYVPSAVLAIISRSEFYTAYTPYQPEINQGLLQALFEYQSLIAELVDLDVVNASLYDMATAAAEAILMAVRVTRRNKILIANNVHPERLTTITTWVFGKNISIEKVYAKDDTGTIDTNDLRNKLSRDVAAFYIEVPSFEGAIEPSMEEIADLVHEKGGLLIVGFEPISLGIIKPPGSYGADIAVGEGQPLGLGLSYGSATLGIMAVKWDRKLVRQLPGRLIGMTISKTGKRGYTMILQTREQHIKREKATSNITTNKALLAIAAAVYLALLGKRGLRELARAIWLKSHYFAKKLNEFRGIKAPAFNAEFFKELSVEFSKDYMIVHEYLKSRGIMGGLPLSKFFSSPKYRYRGLFCITEMHSIKDIDKLVSTLGEIIE